MKRVGIITFHASYNPGSVFQAQATQIAIQNMGYDAEIIDYRPETYDRYDQIYCQRNRGTWKQKLLGLMYWLQFRERQIRIKRYLTYQTKVLKTSSERFKTISDLNRISDTYDVYVSGSDQIWSDKVPEINLAGKETVKGYFLSFTKKKKISYASSVASMIPEALAPYKEYLDQYDAISTREKIGAQRLEEVIGKKVEVVLDPTFLLEADEWKKYTSSVPLVKEPYVLLYSLRNYETEKNWIKSLRVLAKKHHLKIVVVAPYYEVQYGDVLQMIDAGPEEFLNLYANASLVCTDTFHGTAFAINFNKPFYSLGDKYWKGDIRKKALLENVNLYSRNIEDESELENVEDYSCDFTEANAILEAQRAASLAYLKNALALC